MVPIYSGNGEGLGYSFDDFLRRFEVICREHKETGRAQAFAFILYDFYNDALRQALQLQGGFARLDRLTGHDVSVFYLNSSDLEIFEQFNEIFLYAFEIDNQYRLPLVVFFDFEDDDVKEVTIAELYEDHAAFSFNELFTIFQNRLQRMQQTQPPVKKRSKFWSILKSTGGKVADKALEVIFSKIAEKLTNGH